MSPADPIITKRGIPLSMYPIGKIFQELAGHKRATRLEPPRRWFFFSSGQGWLWVKTVLGSQFGVGELTTHFRTYSGD